MLAGASLGAAAAPQPLPRLFSCFGADPSRPDEMASRYAVVIWHNHPQLRQALRQMKRRNPSATGLMYRELFCVLQQEGPLGESVGGHDWIAAHHPEWFQRDRQGRRVEVPDYPGRWMMDLGDPGWQAFWIESTLRDVDAGGWDGVFVDDALTTVRSHALPALAGYPDDASLQEAVTGFLSRITDAFHRREKLVIANASNTYDAPGLWERWLAVTDGLMEEHFAGQGWSWGRDVAPRQLEAMRAAARSGKRMFCMTYGSWDDRGRMETSLAAYLIGEAPGIYWSYRPPKPSDRPAWDAAWQLAVGEPVGEPEALGTVWQRKFQRGVALVNVGPSPQQAVTPCAAVSLQPHEGRVISSDCRRDQSASAWP